jgi:ADP-ribose pyrophosphatase
VIDDARIDSRRVYTGRVIDLDVDRVRFPDGSEGELEIIRHPGASAVVAFLGEATGINPQVMLIRQFRYAASQYLYEIPAGRLDAGERPEECARRELLEETGCTAAAMTFLTSMYTTPGFTDERIHLFVAEGLVPGATRREADEFMEVETMPLLQALEMVRRGEIEDAKTALGLLLADALRTAR